MLRIGVQEQWADTKPAEGRPAAVAEATIEGLLQVARYTPTWRLPPGVGQEQRRR